MCFLLDNHQWNDALALAANDHCKDSGNKVFESHIGSDQSTVTDRVNKYNAYKTNVTGSNRKDDKSLESVSYYNVNFRQSI